MACTAGFTKIRVTSVGLKQELKINHVFWLTQSVASQVQFKCQAYGNVFVVIMISNITVP